MAEVYKGLTIEIGANTVDFNKSVQDVHKELKDLKTEYDKLNAAMKLDPTNTQKIEPVLANIKERIKLLTREQEMYNAALKKAKEENSDFDQSLEKLKDQLGKGEISLKEYRKSVGELEAQYTSNNAVISDAQKHINSLDKQIAKLETTYNSIKGNTISKHFKELGDNAKNAASALSEVSNATRVLSTAATGGLVGAAKAASDFETSIVNVDKVLRETDGVSIEELEGQIKNMAKDIPIALGTISDTFANALQLGVNANDADKFVETLLRLDSATNINSTEGAVQIAQLFNVIGADISNVDKFANSLVRLGNTSATTEKDILEMATTVGASASQVGFTEYQILGLSDALASAGLSSSSAGSAISTILTKIDKAVDLGKAEKWANLLGVSQQELANMWSADAAGTFTNIIGAMKEATDSGESLNLILDDLGLTGIKQDRSIKSLVNGYDLLSTAMENSENAFFKGNDAIDESAAAWDTLNSRITILWNNIKILGVELGNTLLPVVELIVEKITQAVQWLASLDDNNKQLIVTVLGIIAAISPLTGWLSKLFTHFGNIFDILSKITKGSKFYDWLSKIQGALGEKGGLLNIVKGIVTHMGVWQSVLLGVVATIAALYLGNEEFRESINNIVKDVIADLLPILQDILGWASSIFSSLKTLLFPIIKTVIDTLVAWLPTILSIINVIFDAVKWAWDNILKPLGDFLITLFDLIAYALEKTVLPVFKGLMDWVNSFVGGVQKAVDWVRNLLGWQDKSNSTGVSVVNKAGVQSANKIEGGLAIGGHLKSGGFGLNTNGLVMSGGVGALTLHTNINVTNNGTPIDETTIRSWGNTITDIVSNNLGRRM